MLINMGIEFLWAAKLIFTDPTNEAFIVEFISYRILLFPQFTKRIDNKT